LGNNNPLILLGIFDLLHCSITLCQRYPPKGGQELSQTRPRPQNGWGFMDLLGAPGRTLASIVAFMLAVVALATVAYMHAGWSFADASYMVLLTVYTVGYGEVHPIDTPYLHGVTVATMILGCTGMILLTGALVQFLTITQLQQIFGTKRVKAEIEKLTNHVIVVGFGRIGVMLAKDLKTGGAPFLVLEQNEKKAAEARELGHLCLVGDATDETYLKAAGIERARTLATVLPNDAANVFITLSARSLNSGIEIIARGEAPSTESKLLQAGANKVVLPTHIGAERIAEMILFPETARMLRASEKMQELERTLRGLGLEVEVVIVPEKSAYLGLSVEQVETQAAGRFFVLQLNRRNGDSFLNPERGMKLAGGDGVVIVSRGGTAARALFEAPAKLRAGRTTF
jgi:voltage-gated potassium channel